MARVPLFGLHGRLVLLVLLTAVPALTLTVYSSFDQRRTETHRIEAEARRLTALAVSEQQELVDEGRQALGNLTWLPGVQQRDPALCSQQMATYGGSYTQFTVFFALDADGRILCSSVPVTGSSDFSNRDFFQTARRTRQFAVGAYRVGSITGKPVVGLGYPVVGADGQLLTVLGTGLDLTWLNDFAARAQLPRGASLLTLDRNGTVLARSPDAERWVGRTMPDPAALRAILAGAGGPQDPRVVNHDGRFYAFAPLLSGASQGAGPNLYVATSLSAQSAFAHADEVLRRNLVLLAIATLVALLAAWIGSEQFLVRPARALLAAAGRLRAGDLSTRSGLPHERSEVGRLADAFDAMAGSLEQRAQELSRREQYYRSLIERSSDIIVLLDAEAILRYISPSVELVLGYCPDDWIGHSVFELMHPDDLATIKRSFARVREEPGLHDPIAFRFRHADGSWCDLEATANNLLHDPNVQGIIENVRDVNERVRAERALRRSEERFRSLVQNASDIIVVLDREGAVEYASPSTQRVLGYAPEDLVGVSIFTLVHPDELERVRRTFHRRLDEPREPAGANTYRIRHADGTWRRIDTQSTNLLDEPSVAGIVVNGRDVTERVVLEEQLRRQAFYDTLTGLPNRGLFTDRLEHALAAAGRRAAGVAMLFLDLDGFKVVNDSLGHAAGDELVVAVSRRLVDCLRPGDSIARFGGDEFGVLLEDLPPSTASREVGEVAERVLAELKQPFTISGREVFISASIGIASSTPELRYELAEELLRDADIAMYRAKAAGRAGYVEYEASMKARSVARLELETDLRRALERDELRVYYQPEVDLGIGAIVGLEALVRWQHPERGLVAPSEFVPLAEETGLIVPIGRWVLEQACRQAAAWQSEHGGALPLVMSVNLSARQFQQPDLVEQVAAVLEAAQLDPEALRLEITESTAMHDAEAAIATMRELRELGVSLAIDDFGTGYSSLSYLRRFPVDTLKVDQSFLRGLERDTGAMAIVRAVTALAEALGMDVTAEGIESAAQLSLVLQLHCDRGQGFFFCRPLPPDAIGPLLRAGKPYRVPQSA